MIEYDYSKLAGRVKEKLNTQSNFAEALGISEKTLSDKMNNKGVWSQKEIAKSIEILGIEAAEIPIYFFTLKVQD